MWGVIGIRGVSIRFGQHSKAMGGTLGRVSVRVPGNGVVNVTKRDNSNGAALVQSVIKLRGASSNGVAGSSRYGVTVIFRSTIKSLGPHRAVKSTVERIVSVGRQLGHRRTRERVLHLLSIMNLPGSITGRHPKRLDNKRYRHTSVTESLTLGPALLVNSRPMSTLSISIRTHVLGLFSRLLTGGRVRTLLVVARSLTIISTVYSCLCIVGRNGVMRRNVPLRIFTGPRDSCAGGLLTTTSSWI